MSGITPDDLMLLAAYSLEPDGLPDGFSEMLDKQVGALIESAQGMGLETFFRHLCMRTLAAEQELQAAQFEAHEANAALESLIAPPGVTIH